MKTSKHKEMPLVSDAEHDLQTGRINPFLTMPSNPPAAHEDLTIEETLKAMRVSGEHRPGAECFMDESGEKRWVDENAVRDFLREHGAEHPSNFLSNHGRKWNEALFS